MTKFSLEFWNDRGGLKKRRKGRSKNKGKAYEEREKEDYKKENKEEKERRQFGSFHYIL